MSSARTGVLVLLVLAALGVAAPTAGASVAAEQQAGQKLAQHVQSGERSCQSLSKDDLDHIGEFVMGRMIGSTSAHEAMNARMTQVLGATAESQMHQVLGARFTGCASGTANGSSSGAYGGMMGGQGMMGSSDEWDSGDWGSMMDSEQWQRMMGDTRDWNWMMGSGWRNMSDSQWQALQRRLLGTATLRANNTSGWTTRDYLFVGLIVVLAAGLTGVLVSRRPWRRGPQ